MVYATNPSARHDYVLLDKFEAGIELTGAEVKSIRGNRIQIKDSFVKLTQKGEAFLHNSYIAPYNHAPSIDHEPYRTRKLLLNHSELTELARKIHGENLTIVPVRVYNSPSGRIKVEICLARGQRKYEKRAILKEKEVKREIRRTLTRLS